MLGVVWRALRETNVPARTVVSVPALAVMEIGAGVPVGVPLPPSVGVAVVVEVGGGAHAATEGAVAPGQGFNCPKTCPLISPNPFLRGPMLVKSMGGGVPPGVTSSGKIHSVTGCTYAPALMPSPVVISVSPILTR